MTVNISHETESKLSEIAQREGLDAASVIEKLVREYKPVVPDRLTADNDPLLAQIEARLASAPTDLDAIRAAEEDLEQLMRSMNASREAVGGRLPFPTLK